MTTELIVIHQIKTLTEVAMEVTGTNIHRCALKNRTRKARKCLDTCTHGTYFFMESPII